MRVALLLRKRTTTPKDPAILLQTTTTRMTRPRQTPRITQLKKTINPATRLLHRPEAARSRSRSRRKRTPRPRQPLPRQRDKRGPLWRRGSGTSRRTARNNRRRMVSSRPVQRLSPASHPLLIDSSPNAELDSAIEILTAATRPVIVPSPQINTLSLPSNDTLSTQNNLSNQEVASLRALLDPASQRRSPVSKRTEGDDKEEAAFGRVKVSLENMAEAVREMERGSEVSMRIGELQDVALDMSLNRLCSTARS